MSKKKDRCNTEVRYCSICGSKAIIVDKIKNETYIECGNCESVTKIELY